MAIAPCVEAMEPKTLVIDEKLDVKKGDGRGLQ